MQSKASFGVNKVASKDVLSYVQSTAHKRQYKIIRIQYPWQFTINKYMCIKNSKDKDILNFFYKVKIYLNT